jgi:O-antigen ligase
VASGHSRIALWLLGVVALAAIASGFHGGHGPILLAEVAGALFLLWRLGDNAVAVLWQQYRDAAPWTIWLLLSLGVGVLQIAWGSTSSLWETQRQLHHYAAALLLTPLFASVIPAVRTERGAWLATCLLAVLLLVPLLTTSVAIRQPGAGSQEMVWWPFVYRNHYAAFALLLLPALLWVAVRSGSLRWPALFAILFAIAGVLSCGSRSGFLGLLAIAVLFPVLVFLNRQLHRPAPWMLFAFPVVVAGALFLARPELLLWRWQYSGGLLEGRLDYWLATLQMIAEKPLLGWGLGVWPDVYLQFMQQDPGLVVNRAHSDFLEFAAEGGVLLPLALAGLFLRSVWLACRFPWALGLPVLLVLAMADYPLRLPLLLWAFLAIYLAAEAEARGAASLCLPTLLRSSR